MTFDLGYDGTSPPEKVEIEDGAILSPIKDPVRSGYQFDGWYTADGKPYNFDTPITESFTLTARWKIKSSGGGGGGGSSAPSEEESLKGQWAVYMEGVETPMGNIIDIQHTLPDYWIAVNTSEEPVIGIPFKSDRTGPDKEGRFVVSLDNLLGVDAEMSYSFVDNERNTLKAEAKKDDITAMTFILKRIPSEEEINMHIVSFKLDDSLTSAGYVLTSDDDLVLESLAIEAGKAFGEKGLPILKQNGTEVPALFTLADGTEFTKDTPVTDDITVTVTPPGVWDGIHYVSTEDELLAWANALTADPSLDCVLLADIDLKAAWNPVGYSVGYAGTFDGRGHSINYVKIVHDSHPGIFNGIAEEGSVKNLTVEVSYTGTGSYRFVGAVAGTNKGTIENCHSITNGTVSDISDAFGGIAAVNEGSIIGCSSRISGYFSSSKYAGGIAGENKGMIAASYMILEGTGSLAAGIGKRYGGIAGSNENGSVIGCYSIGVNEETVSITPNAIAGDGSLNACYWQSSVDVFVPNDNSNTNVTEVNGTTTTWTDAMDAMNSALKTIPDIDVGYEFQLQEGDDTGTKPPIIVPSST